MPSPLCRSRRGLTALAFDRNFPTSAVEGETCCTQALGVGRKIQLAIEDAGFQLHRAIATIAHVPQNRPQVRQKENIHRRVCRQPLLESKVTGLFTKISLLQTLEQATVAMENVSSRIEAVYRMDDQIEVV